MPKKASKKTSKNVKASTQKKLIKKSSQSKKKLGPGKKQCKNCRYVMPIHTKICAKCQHVHEMKKKKQDIMKNLNKITPIVIKSIIQNRDFNKFIPWPAQSQSFSIGTLTQIQPPKHQQSTNNTHTQNLPHSSTAQLNITRAKSQQKVPKSLPKRRSTPAPLSHILAQKQRQKQKQKSHINNFKQSNHELVQYMTLGQQQGQSQQNNNICCMATSKYWLAFVQSTSKQAVGLQQKEEMTIKAYSLKYFNLVGVKYIGESVLWFAYSSPQMTNLNQLVFHKVCIKYHVLKIKIFANLVMVLTGLGTVVIFSLPNYSKNQQQKQYQLTDKIQITQPQPDRITAFEFLRSTSSLSPPSLSAHTLSKHNKHKQSPSIQQILIVTGTQYGRISIYKITKTGYTIVRYIPNAHMEMVTSIAQCPMNMFRNKYNISQQQKIQQQQEQQEQQDQQKNNNNSVLFTTSSYDGTIFIWNLYQHRPIFQYQCSNRKIWSVFWDPGNKYLIVNRDQIVDPCVILCFYSINKIQTTVNFANSVQIRTVKTQRCITLIHHDYYSQKLPVLDPITGILKLLQVQQLRGSSLKKKKIKKDQRLEKVYKIGWRDGFVPVVEEINQSQQEEQKKNNKENNKEKDKEQKKKMFPMFSDLCIQAKNGMEFVYLTGYNGTLVVLKNIVKNQ